MGKLGLSEGENTTLNAVHTWKGMWYEKGILLNGEVLKETLNRHLPKALESEFLYWGDVEPNGLQDLYPLSSFMMPSSKDT